MKKALLLFAFCMFSLISKSQSVGISESSFIPDPSSILDISSIEKGMLLPRMNSTQKDGIISPATGLIIYDTDTNTFWFYNSEEWVELGDSPKFEEMNCTPGSTTINTLPQETFDDCGVLYDSGGDAGPYGDNELYFREIVGDSGGSIRKVTINSVVLDAGDTLTISTLVSTKVYTGINFDMETLYLPANESVIVQFKSDAGPSTGDGFEITWSTFEPIPTNVDQRFGFFCNSEKQSIGGGIQLNDEWGEGSGFQNINFGVFANTDGESSIAIGTHAQSKEEGISIGASSYADNGGVSVGYNAISSQFRSIAIGHAQATGNTSIAIGENAKAEGLKTTALGYLARALGESGFALGDNAFAHGNESLVFGNNSSVLGDNSLVIGNDISSICDDCIILGKEGFGSPKVGINTMSPSTDFEVGGNMKAKKLDVQDTFGEIAITSNNATLHPTLSLYKTNAFNLVGSITSNLSDELVLSSPNGILNEGNTFVSGMLSTSSLTGSGNRDVYVNGQGKLIVKPEMTHYYSIPPSAFVSESEDSYPLNYGKFSTATSPGTVFDETDEVVLYAPVNLPSGAEVAGIDFVYFNQLEELDIDFRLKRRSIYSASDVTVCHIVGGGGAPPYTVATCEDVNGAYSEIDNENFLYYIQIGESGDELPTELKGGFHGVRIVYVE